MTPTSFIVELKRTIPEATWSYVIAALRKDTLIWESLQFTHGDFGQRVLARGSGHPEDYSAAALALLALDYPTPLKNLRSSPLQSVESSFHQRTAQTLDEDTLTLEQAGLRALNLREHRLDKGSWVGLTGELNEAAPTVLACLYGMIPEPLEMLQAIIQSGDSTSSDFDSQTKPYALVLHSLLSNPIPLKRQAQILEGLVEGLSPQQRLILLRQLVNQRPFLATSLARLITNHTDDQPNQPGTLDPLDELDPLVCQAESYHISAQHAEEISVLIKSQKVSRRIQARLSAKLARAAAQNNDGSAALSAWEQASRIDPDSPYYLSGLILTLLDLDRLADAQTLIDAFPPDAPPHPLLFLAKARLSAHGQDRDLESARMAAIQALELAISQPLDHAEHIDFLFSVTNLFLDYDLPDEATRAAQFALQVQPDDPNSLALLAQAHHAAGDPAEALNAIHVAVALTPDRLDLRYQLAESLETTGEWEAALDERSIILERIENPSPSDLRATATCALHARQPEQAVQICEQMLHIRSDQDTFAYERHDADDGLTFALLGEATAAIGDNQTALEYLQRATDLAPQHAVPWTALARVYQLASQPQEALEALRTGTHSASDQPEVHLTLGETLLANDSPTQALAALRRAADLVRKLPKADHHYLKFAQNGKSSSWTKRNNALITRDLTSAYLNGQIALRLGQTLHQLGHFAEARQVLEPAYHTAPSNPDIAFAYAQTLLALDDLYMALSPLEVVIQSEPDDSTPYFAYARTLLMLADKTEKSHPSKTQLKQGIRVELAVPLLERALEISPDLIEAKILLADALAASGDLHQAMEEYCQLMETNLIREPEWQTRLSIGYGQVAIKLDQLEIAIAILQEADQANPHNCQIQQSLSEAYDALGLTEDAYQSAQDALHLSPNDPDTLTWFAKQVLELRTRPGVTLPEAQSKALAALNHATQIDPDRTDLLAQLGQAQLLIGDHHAHDTFKKLLSTKGGTTNDLHQAAIGLIQLGDAHGAVVCLERALETFNSRSGEGNLPKTQSYTSQLDLLTTLFTARYQTGNLHAALEALDQAISIAPDEPNLYLDKANVLLELDPLSPEPSDTDTNDDIHPALTCLKTALDSKPDDPVLLKRAALIQRTAGDLPAALVSAEQMIVTSTTVLKTPPKPGQGFALPASDLYARTLAADLARALLQPKRALAILDHHQYLTKNPAESIKTPEQTDHTDQSVILDYYFLRAELALDMGEDAAADGDMEVIIELEPDHPRTLAIQARLTTHSGNIEAAFTALQGAVQAVLQPGPLEKINTSTEPDSQDAIKFGFQRRGEAQNRLVNDQMAVAEAALELFEWDTALQLFREVAKAAPFEPLSHVSLARALVLRAETQRLCQAMDVVHHAPGESALSEDAYQSFVTAIEAADQYINPWENGQIPIHQAPITRWRARGQAIFEPDQESADALATLPANPEDVAAHVACLNEIEDLTATGVAARAFPRHAPVLIRLALALGEEKPHQAMAAAYAAAESLHRPETLHKPEAALISESDHPPAHIYRNALEPLPHALLARLVHRSGNVDGKYPPAQKSIQKALTFWPDEPRWHVLAAEIYLAQDNSADQENITAAITHLEQAIELEPELTTPHLILGRIYIHNGHFEKAIKVLDQASHLVPDQPEPWLILARAERAIGDLEQAASHAARATTMAPEQIAPLLLNGEIALDADDPTKARTLAQTALQVKPDDPSALLLLARALKALDKTTESLEILEKAIILAQEPLPLLLERARQQKCSVGLEAALQTLQELTRRYPDEPTVLAILAETLDEAGRSEESIHNAQRALHAGHERRHHGNFEEHANMHRLLGRQMRHIGQLDQAIHHLSEAIRLAPHILEPYLELGDAHKDGRQHAQALNVYQQAISVAPDDPRAFHQAGLALKECKEYIGAETMLRRAAELAPDNVGIHRLLGAVVALNLVHNRRRSPLNV